MSSEMSSSNTLQPPPINRRKLSFPAALHHNLLGVPDAVPGARSSTRRRFSNVSDVVTRKFSTTIGWRSTSIPTHDIVTQGKTLCGQYIRCRLKRNGMFNRKCGLQRLRSVSSLPGGYIVLEVFPELLSIGQELERMHPKIYTGVARQASSSPGGGVLATDKAVNNVMTSVGREMFRTEITWAKIVSLFAVAGGLAVDCVRQGHPEYLQCIIESTGEVLEDEVGSWIAVNGGWSGLLSYCKPPNNEISLVGFVGLLGAVMASALFLVLILRWFGKFAFI